MVKMPNFYIREGNIDDIPGIAQLYREVGLDRDISPEEYALWWKWLFIKNPYSIKKIFVGIDERNKVIAHCALIPFKFLVEGRSFLGGSISQLMVAKEFRKELVFLQMEMRILKEYKASGIDFAYGLINMPGVLKAHLALGFRKLGVLPVYARPYKLYKLTRFFIKSEILDILFKPVTALVQPILRLKFYRRPNKLKITEIEQFDSNIDMFLSSMREYFSCGELKNSEILNWRFVHSPKRKYKIFIARDGDFILGYVVIGCMSMNGFNSLTIVDILFSPERFDVGKALLDVVHGEAIRSNVELSVCLLNPSDPLLPVLRRCGYLKTPRSFSLILHEQKDVPSLFKGISFHQWHLTWFNHDYV